MLKSTIKILIAAMVALCAAQMSTAQRFAVKNDLLDDALLNPNLAAEVKLAPKWSLELLGQINAWELNHGEKMWKHWLAMPEARYWLCDVWDGHFFGAHVFGGQYNIGGIKGMTNFLGTDFSKLADYRYQGWYVGAGIAYGYDWIINRHWNIEAEIGIGWAYTRWDQFRCVGCGKKIKENQPHNYFGPTKAAINVVYIF